jgi:hypothetical protein
MTMTRRSRQIILFTTAGLVPISLFLFPFLCGFYNLSQGYLMLLVPISLFGTAFVGIAVGASVPRINKLSRIGVGIFAWILTIAFFFVLPPAAKTWTLGFSTNFKMTKHPKEVQQWASGILDRYEAGQLNTVTNAPYWAVGKEKLDATDVPSRIAELWRVRPSIGIAEVTPDGEIFTPSHDDTGELRQYRCVAFSWYLTGILVGRSEFRTTWNPWYIQEIAPGIYVYCGMK